MTRHAIDCARNRSADILDQLREILIRDRLRELVIGLRMQTLPQHDVSPRIHAEEFAVRLPRVSSLFEHVDATLK